MNTYRLARHNLRKQRYELFLVIIGICVLLIIGTLLAIRLNKGGTVTAQVTQQSELPVSPEPANGAVGVPIYTDGSDPNTVLLRAAVDDAAGSHLAVSFYGRLFCQEPPSFTLVALPDTQYYTSQPNGDGRALFDAQTQWIVDNQSTYNIVFVSHLGDIVDEYNLNAQWNIAGSLTDPIGALTRLDNAGIPYGVAVGNHDTGPEGTQDFNSYFGESRFAGRPYYGGHYGTDNDNNYDLFSSDGLYFMVINLEYTTTLDPNVLAWANDLLEVQFPTRRGIVVYHNLLTGYTTPAPFTDEGQAIYDALKGNANLFLMLGGHIPTEVSRTDTFNGHTVYSLRADYQSRGIGDGWLRLMEFQPATNQIQVYTYSPYLNQWETDADSQFTLPYPMGGEPCPPFDLIQTLTKVSSGTTPKVNWGNRSTNTQYEWYVTSSDGTYTETSPVWSFTTGVTTTVEPVSSDATSTTGITTAVEPVSINATSTSNGFQIFSLVVLEIAGLAIIFIGLVLYKKRR